MHINDLSLFQALQSGLWYSVEEANHNTETLKCVFIHEHFCFSFKNGRINLFMAA
jgi:hypothetical protein